MLRIQVRQLALDCHMAAGIASPVFLPRILRLRGYTWICAVVGLVGCVRFATATRRLPLAQSGVPRQCQGVACAVCGLCPGVALA